MQSQGLMPLRIMNVRIKYSCNLMVDYAEMRRKNQTTILGIWDDHDYGQSNGCNNFARKDD